MQGKVKWFDIEKGYGFIRPEDGSADVFVHISAVEDAGLIRLREGEHIGFELETNRRNGKTAAVNIQRL